MFFYSFSSKRLFRRLLLLTAAIVFAIPLLTAACVVQPAPTLVTTVAPTGTSIVTGPSSTTNTDTSGPDVRVTESTGSEQTSVSDTTGSQPGDTSGSSGSSQTSESVTSGTSTGATTPGNTKQPSTSGSTAPGTTKPATSRATTLAPATTKRPTTLPPTTQPPATTQPPTATNPATEATTRATTTAPTTQGSVSNFPVKNYGTFSRSQYGSNAEVTTSADGIVSIDVGDTRKGVVLVKISADTGKAWKCILKGPSGSYQYDLLKRNTYEGVPLQMGSGAYTLTVYEQVSGTSYSTHTAHSFNVSLSSSLSPYTASSIIVDFSGGSASVSRAGSLVSGKTDQVARIEAIYNWVVDNISYDRDLAGRITSKEVKTYIPDPDQTMSTRKGICYDYAALMAAMLRSQGIPTRLIMGLVPQGYHAWNEVYLAGTGWVVIASFNYRNVDGSAWVMFDPTFAASNMSEEKILNTTHTKQRTY